ncbi:MAG: alpha/beta fold hydrolase [Myxococcota bacterium]
MSTEESRSSSTEAHQHVDVGDDNLFTCTSGTGTPLLCMHGGLGLDHTYFRPWLEPIADDARVVLYDHRGNGRSTRPPSYDPMSIATLAEDAERLRAKLDLGRIVLLGHSYGGIVALQYALSHQDTLRGLVLCATAPCFDHLAGTIGQMEQRMTDAQRTAFTELGKPRPLDDRAFAEHARTILPLYFHRPVETVLDVMHRCIHYSGAAYAVSMRDWLPAFDVRSRLHELRIPVLVVSGAQDWITPPAIVEDLASKLPNAELHVLEGSGHYPFVERQQQFTTVLRQWLRCLA